MTQQFTAIAKNADTGMKSAVRALQAWQYLIAKAHNRQIVKYDELTSLMEYGTSKPLSSILGCIMNYCDREGLPPLTIIVVNRFGIPGAGFTAAEPDTYHRRREEVFAHPWFRQVPPTVQELRAAYTGAAADVET
jgi:hypothetical protein